MINDPQHPYTRALLNAVPEPDPEAAAHKLPGGGLRSADIPSLAALPSGCTFHPRCPIAEDGLCDVQEPRLAPIGDSAAWSPATWSPARAAIRRILIRPSHAGAHVHRQAAGT